MALIVTETFNSEATGINNLGQVVGVSDISDDPWGPRHAVLWITIQSQTVEVDIKPGSDPNSINLGDQGLLPVAILGDNAFDVVDIDPATVLIGTVGLDTRGSPKVPKLAYSLEDINGDGINDLMAFFSIPELVAAGVLDETTTSLTLTGNLFDGIMIEGTDSIRVIPP